MYFDSHCHFHDARFAEDRAEALVRAREAGVTHLLTLGSELESSRAAIALAESDDGIYAAAGVHPSDAADWDDSAGAALQELLAHPKVPVLGEIGLDYYWDKSEETKARQHLAFREQLRLARHLKMPISIHSRDSNADVLRFLEEEHGEEFGGVLHCFIASEEEMRRGIDLGFAIGVGGIATYKKSDELRAALRAIGPEHLLLETDAPYLPPQPRRGRRNEPAYVAMTAELLAPEFGVTPEQLGRQCAENTRRAFRL